jgi:hypothetical protein
MRDRDLPDADDGVSRRRLLTSSATAASLVWAAPTVRSLRLVASAGSPEPSPTSTTFVPGPMPVVEAISVCSPEAPFAVQGRVSGFPSNTRFGFNVLFRFADGSESRAGSAFTTDAEGNAEDIGSVGASQPFTASINIWPDPNENGQQDPSEATFFSGTLTIDEPCTGGTFTPD